MDLHQLRYFVAVAERLHFAEAAESVHVSQPGLSQQIKALEEEVGVLLLERTKRTVALTEAGKYFLEEAKLTLEHAERAKVMAQQVARGKLGTVRIGYVPSVPFSGLLANLASVFRKCAAGVHLEFAEGESSDQMRRLVEGEIDLGFIRLPLADIPPEIVITTVMEEKILVAMHKDHPLARKKKIRCAELKNERLVLYSRPDGKSSLDDQVNAIAQKGGFDLQVTQTAERLTAVIGLVAGASGIAIVPESLHYMHVPSVVFRPLADIQLLSELAVACRRDEHSPAVNSVLTKLREGTLHKEMKKRNGAAKSATPATCPEAQPIRNIEPPVNAV
ncbi:MAG TPA: LysR substrate-binding domain-containing protein [Chthoniobacterales bacterium]|jgi:DNA-binding transcriptional LysR family regulator|nr:LysR substrate-binding domain-containing protein [Chthoniobacterales bacterium]